MIYVTTGKFTTRQKEPSLANCNFVSYQKIIEVLSGITILMPGTLKIVFKLCFRNMKICLTVIAVTTRKFSRETVCPAVNAISTGKHVGDLKFTNICYRTRCRKICLSDYKISLLLAQIYAFFISPLIYLSCSIFAY